MSEPAPKAAPEPDCAGCGCPEGAHDSHELIDFTEVDPTEPVGQWWVERDQHRCWGCGSTTCPGEYE